MKNDNYEYLRLCMKFLELGSWTQKSLNWSIPVASVIMFFGTGESNGVRVRFPGKKLFMLVPPIWALYRSSKSNFKQTS